METPFEILGLPVSLLLEPEQIDSAWRERASAAHPDSGPEQDKSESVSDSAAINEARQILLDPANRLASWIRCHTGSDPSATGSLSEDLMSLFQKSDQTFTRTDILLKKHGETTTALSKALLAKEAVAVQLKLQELLSELGDAIQQVTARFPEFEAAVSSSEMELRQAGDALATLRFLKKWETGCRERLLSLIAL